MNGIGWCAEIEQAAWLAEKGFDYIECPLSSLSLEDDRAFAEKLPLSLNSPLKVRATNRIPSGRHESGRTASGPGANS